MDNLLEYIKDKSIPATERLAEIIQTFIGVKKENLSNNLLLLCLKEAAKQGFDAPKLYAVFLFFARHETRKINNFAFQDFISILQYYKTNTSKNVVQDRIVEDKKPSNMLDNSIPKLIEFVRNNIATVDKFAFPQGEIDRLYTMYVSSGVDVKIHKDIWDKCIDICYPPFYKTIKEPYYDDNGKLVEGVYENIHTFAPDNMEHKEKVFKLFKKHLIFKLIKSNYEWQL